MNKNLGKNKGITLVALIVTIIILLILAGVAIDTLVGKEGLINKAQEAKKIREIGKYKEELKLKIYELNIEMQGKATLLDFVNLLDEDDETYIIEIAQMAVLQSGIPDLTGVKSINIRYRGYIYNVNSSLNVEYIETDEEYNLQMVKVIYNSNGGEEELQEQQVRVGNIIVLKENTFKKAGYNFCGWSKTQDGLSDNYMPGDRLEISEDTILYAQWESNNPILKSANKVLNESGNTTLYDRNNNKIVVPAGFKIVVNNDTGNVTTVDKGIVIEDATLDKDGNPTVTNGSQFVWIPVGNIKKDDDSIVTIELNRYSYNADGEMIPIGENESVYTISYTAAKAKELDGSNSDGTTAYGNMAAISISDFKNSVNSNGGYYIGRYEARTTVPRTKSTDEETILTEKGNDYIYWFVTQLQAAKLSRNMYKSNNFTSDLLNSYSWDTAMEFFQKCGTNTAYSVYNVNEFGNPSWAEQGSNCREIKDIQCNVFDIATNTREYTTETSLNINSPCVTRGDAVNCGVAACIRVQFGKTSSRKYEGFRPILYLK